MNGCPLALHSGSGTPQGARQGWIGSNNDKQTEQDTKGLWNLLNGPLAPEEWARLTTTPEFNIQLWWAYWTPSGGQHSITVSSLDTLHISISNYSDILWSSIFHYSEPIGHPPHFNIKLQWAYWTPSGVQHSTTVSLLDTLRSSIFNSGEPIRHPPELNIRLLYTNLY